MTMTPADHRAQAEAALDRMRGYAAGTTVYHGLVLSAIAHTLAAVAEYLEPPPVPQIPGLPAGWELDLHQAEAGERKWGYVLRGPDGREYVSRHRWDSSGGALVAGIQAANDNRDEVAEMQLWVSTLEQET